MSYRVGIDFGTTFTAAAVHRDGEQAVELVPLGDNKAAVPSVVYVAPDGGLVMGDAAVRRAVTDPDRVVREVKRRIGDETPLLVAGSRIEAHTVAATFVRWVVDRVSEREGEPPEGLALTHPASWGRHKCALLMEALVAQGIGATRLVPEPAAAAFAYAAARNVPPGAAVGVYDLGGGTFDTAIVRRLDDGGFALAGSPEGIESLGGVDFDEAVFAHVRAAVGPQWMDVDFEDPLVRSAAATLRRECTEAKEALSADTEVAIPVLLPGLSTRVRMVRTELEQLVAPAIAETVEALRRACASAGLAPDELSAVLLAGGSSRIPLVAQRVSAALDRPVTVDADPKAVVASGAALSIAPKVVRAGTTPTVLAPAASASSGRWPRRGLLVGVGIAACLTVLVATASTVGTDLLADGGTPVGAADTADLPREVVDRVPIGTPSASDVDPWTGEPFEETTAPGPKRPGAKPTEASPAVLAPAPSAPGTDRTELIEGEAPPAGQTKDTPSSSSQPQPQPQPEPDGDVSENPPPPGSDDPPPDPSSESPPPDPEPSVDSSAPPPPAEPESPADAPEAP